MKKYIILSAICLSVGKVFGQNHSAGVLVGKPLFTDAEKHKKNIGIGANYTYDFHKNWAIEGYYLYAQNDNSTTLAKNEAAAATYASTLGTNWRSYKWDKITNHNIGAAVHYYIAKNQKWSLSANGGLWYTRSDSEAFTIKKTETAPGYDTEFITNGTQNFGYSFGGDVRYNVFGNYFVGFSPRLFRVFNTDNSEKSAVHPNHYHLLLNFGVRF
ncbi:MAG: hypothetical protein Q4G16_12370 [Cruoricaptor ignavus]|nr:hypothetical protein [Cruoricaptor ignavus]